MNQLLLRQAFVVTLLTCLATPLRSQARDSLVLKPICYELSYSAPENNAKPSQFPRTVALSPGRDSGDASADSASMLRALGSWEPRNTRYFTSFWRSKGDSIQLVFARFSSSVVAFPKPLRDTLPGRAEFASDYGPANEPGKARMTALARRVSCPP